MKLRGIAIIATSIIGLGSPALAQFNAESDQFVDAVEKADGDKAMQLFKPTSTFVDARNAKGDTVLIIALARSDSDWTAFLLNKGADPNLPARANGDTPLIVAARVGFEDGAEWLLSVGAKVDGANRMGETPLIVAVQQREPELVKLLLKSGADPDKPDSAAGYSARDYAARDPRAREILQLIQATKAKAGR